METYQQSTNRVAESAACRVAANNASVDRTGRDRDDYRQVFNMAALVASASTPDHGKDVHKKWASTAIRNRLKTCRRELVRAPDFAEYDEEVHVQITYEEERVAKRMDQRKRLQKLREVLTPDEWQILQDYVVHGCNAASVWRAYGKPLSCRWFCKGVRTLLNRCRQIISRG